MPFTFRGSASDRLPHQIAVTMYETLILMCTSRYRTEFPKLNTNIRGFSRPHLIKSTEQEVLKSCSICFLIRATKQHSQEII